MNFRPILFITGILISVLSACMIVPVLIDLYMGHDDWKVFCLCMTICLFFGGALILTNNERNLTLNRRQTFLITSLGWLTVSVFGALPFMVSELNMNIVNSFFESVSGVTTTGSTVINGLDSAPPGILIWRAMLQWLGGLGVIVMAVSIMPFLKIGGMQLFRSDLAESEKALPRTTKLAISIGLIYLALTLLCITAYNLGGMNRFDAVATALSTISTGGFATHDASIGYFENSTLYWIAILFMIAGGVPFILFLKASKGDIAPLFKDSQVKVFLLTILAAATVIAIYLYLHQNMDAGEAVLTSFFSTVSLITGTGFTIGNYNLWGTFALAIFFFLMAVGGCAGSTASGIKIFRFQVFFAIIRVQVHKLFHPHGVFVANYNGKPIASDVPLSVISFLFLYAACFLLVTLSLSLTGLDFMTSLSGAMTSLSNVGPGMGNIIGPAGDFSSLPGSAKWILCASMLLGRLEILAVLVLFQKHFWQH